MGEEKKSKMLTVAMIISLIIVAALGVTYAYFTTTIKGNEDAKSTKVTTGTLDILFESSQYIKNTNAMLILDSERETKADYTAFTIKHNHTSTINAKYQIYLTELEISDNFKDEDVKWEILKNDELLHSGNFATIGNATTMVLTEDVHTLGLDDTDSYVFRIWLSEDGTDQLNLTNGSIKGRIMVEAVNA